MTGQRAPGAGHLSLVKRQPYSLPHPSIATWPGKKIAVLAPRRVDLCYPSSVGLGVPCEVDATLRVRRKGEFLTVGSMTPTTPLRLDTWHRSVATRQSRRLSRRRLCCLIAPIAVGTVERNLRHSRRGAGPHSRGRGQSL